MFVQLLHIQLIQQKVRLNNIIKYILAIFFALASYGYVQGKDLDYSTKQIRTMWFECSTGFRVNFPKMPEQIKIVLCDCYINYMRKKYSAEQVLEITKEESSILGLEVAQICKIPEELIKTKRVRPQGAA